MKTISSHRDERDSISAYLDHIAGSHAQPIPAYRQAQLARKAQAGDVEARQRLISANVRFVFSIAKEMDLVGLSLADRISAGNEGLADAVDKYDPDQGFRFITYAVWWIRQRIYQEAKNTDLVRVPENRLHLWNQMKAEHDALEKKLDRPATTQEIEAATGQDGLDLSEYAYRLARIESLSRPADPDDPTFTYETVLADNAPSALDTLGGTQRGEWIRALVNRLPHKRERTIIDRFFGLSEGRPETLESISKSFNLSRERVRQLKERSLTQLREWAAEEMRAGEYA